MSAFDRSLTGMEFADKVLFCLLPDSLTNLTSWARHDLVFALGVQTM